MKPGLLPRIAARLRTISEARAALSQALSLEIEVKKKRIELASDLNHEFLQKTLNALKPGYYVQIYLKSGEMVQLSCNSDEITVDNRRSATW